MNADRGHFACRFTAGAPQPHPRLQRPLRARSVLDYSSYHLSRTAFDDDATGANRAHDANYATFHRIDGFRREL